ncbi:MAG: hypothetical protein KF901_30530 [Myxococcales bacterium]|nr:hypothetical protein [Myxococcales bacterium]
MDETVAALSRIRRFVGSMKPDVPALDDALPELRRLLAAAGVPYRLVGGVAVVHHGYVRATEDIDVLVPADALEALDAACEAHGFERATARRLRHRSTGVSVDLLVAGDAIPRGEDVYPDPTTLDVSETAPDVVGLTGLARLKLMGRRHQDDADLVALLQRLDEGEYLGLEAATPPHLRGRLLTLREDALEELRFATD